MSTAFAKEMTAWVTKLTNTTYCYGHRAWMLTDRFDPQVVGKPRALCFTCTEKRNKHAHPYIKNQ
jgi:hypothetical protein